MIDLIKGDCLEVMKTIESNSIDTIITDPPYGTTACKWDSVIPFEPMWEQINRIIKPNGAIVLFGSEPFSSALRMSNLKGYKHDWIWSKKMTGGFANAKYKPMKAHEEIIVFSNDVINYYPQMIERTEKELKRFAYKSKETTKSDHRSCKGKTGNRFDNKMKYPSTVININGIVNSSNEKAKHPTQKPLELMRYLINTYSNKGDTILDFTMGSGSTMVACVETKRDGIGIELDETYYNLAKKRVREKRKEKEIEAQTLFNEQN